MKRALCEVGYVDEISGLAEVQRRAEEAEMEGFSDEDGEGDF